MVKVKRIALENYKGIQRFDTELSDRIQIEGKNALGKSTIADAYFDVITGKLADGSSPDAIRPHDANGNDIDRIDIVRSLTLEIDGKTSVVEKKTSQKWRKPRGTVEEVFDGNVTSYTIDGFEKKSREIDDFLGNIADSDTLRMCSNPAPFLAIMSKSTAEARKTLEKLSGFDINDFIKSDPNYGKVEEILNGHPVEDVVKKLKKDLAIQRKAVETTKSNLVYTKSKVVEVPELSEVMAKKEELYKKIKVYTDSIASMKEKLESFGQVEADLQNLQDKKSEIQRKSIAAHQNKVDKYYKHLDTLNNTWAKAFNAYNDAKMGASKIKSKIEMLQNDFNAARTAYENAKKTVFTPQTGKCPYVSGTCEKLEKVLDTANAKSKAKFDKEKKKEIDKLIQEGIRLRDELKAAQDELKTVSEQEAASEADYKEKLSAYETEKNNPPEQNIPDMTELDKQISEFSERISEAKTIRANIDGTNEIIARLNAENADLDKKIEVSNALVAQKESEISALEDQLKDDVQKCANIEMHIDMIQDFSMKKNAALSNAVNKHFHYINFKLFDKTIEGNEYETLKIMVNGTDYMNGLNHGARILADVDLVQGLQEMNGLNLPIWIDDSESLDPDKIPNTKQQLIVLRRTDADHLTVKEI